VRTSEPLWRSLFETSLTSVGDQRVGSFNDTPHYYMSHFVHCLAASRDSASEAIAQIELWISIGIFDALEASLREVLRHGTEDEQVELCRNLALVYVSLSFGSEDNTTLKQLIRQQLPRPRTIRLLWDISLKLSESGSDVQKVAASHACRVSVAALELAYVLPNACSRRGCEETSTARCARCKSGYCHIKCQKRDWKDHKMVCNIEMDMEPTIGYEAEKLLSSWTGIRR